MVDWQDRTIEGAILHPDGHGFTLQDASIDDISACLKMFTSQESELGVTFVDENGIKTSGLEIPRLVYCNIYKTERAGLQANFECVDDAASVPQTIAEKAAAYDILMGGA